MTCVWFRHHNCDINNKPFMYRPMRSIGIDLAFRRLEGAQAIAARAAEFDFLPQHHL